MPQIDQFTFRTWQGRLRPADRIVGVLPAPPGSNGNAVVYGGWQAPIASIRTGTVISGDYLTAEQTGEQYRALTGQAVAVVDQFGRLWPAVRVLRVVYDPSETALSSQIRLVAHWRLLVESEAPEASV